MLTLTLATLVSPLPPPANNYEQYIHEKKGYTPSTLWRTPPPHTHTPTHPPTPPHPPPHPQGFNKTGMTAKYKEIWDVEGAVDVAVGAKRVLHEVNDGFGISKIYAFGSTLAEKQ
ncbi:hypothetical protein T492DRAFT_1149727 [Pavlovales sp. CCMP2436]|nr:hypothetical protein T492DRAFT_1149727 [Pavlovales sp. CCMP2436]